MQRIAGYKVLEAMEGIQMEAEFLVVDLKRFVGDARDAGAGAWAYQLMEVPDDMRVRFSEGVEAIRAVMHAASSAINS